MIIGTAGHIDHGKSALVAALTGRKMDRLAEERRRGMTIDLNFAPLEFAGLPPAGIVDVPGHEDFVRTMVAGASGIDLVLLVVDGSQGPQPQTWEHLAIVEQLRIARGIPVITKADLAEPEWLELVTAELMERLGTSPVAFEEPARTSVVSGLGIAELTERLRQRVMVNPPTAPADWFRMPVDRSFSIAGIGTVVTGTPWSGEIRVGGEVTILPGGITARVRSLEAYGHSTLVGAPGARTAVGLVGIDRDQVGRGDVLVGAGEGWRPTNAIDALVELVPDAAPVRRRLRVRFHLGTAEVMARLYPREEIAAGGTGLVRVAFESPVLARGGDRFVLRSYSPVRTIGGGRVLDPLPPRRAPWPGGLGAEALLVRAEALVSRRPGGATAPELPLLLGVPEAEGRRVLARSKTTAEAGGRYVASTITSAIRSAILATIQDFHRREPTEKGLSLATIRDSVRAPASVTDAILNGLLKRGEVVATGGTAALPGFAPESTGQEELLTRVLEVLESAGLSPPTVPELEEMLGVTGLVRVLRSAAERGKVEAVEGDRFFSTTSLNQFSHLIREIAVDKGVTPQILREKTGLSRKYLIPLLEWADRTGITRRVGDERVLRG